MKFMEEKSTMTFQIKQIGKKIVKLGKGKKSFGSFFLPCENEEVMTYLPYFQQAIWGCPMNKEKTIFWEYHKDLSEINNYDFKIIFIYEPSNDSNILFRKSKRFFNTYEIVLQMPEKRVGSAMNIVISNFMTENPYL